MTGSEGPRNEGATRVGPKTVRWRENGEGVETLMPLLQDLSWKSVEKEIRGLIPALTELMLCAPNPTPVEVIPAWPAPERLNQFAKAWCRHPF